MTKSEILQQATTIQGWMSQQELSWLAEQATRRLDIAEVGVWKGRSTYVLAGLTPGRVVAIDHWKGAPNTCSGPTQESQKRGADTIKGEFLENTRAFESRIEIFESGSFEAATHFKPGSLDFVFLDGDHSEEAVRKDISLYRPLLRPGGMLAGHDYKNGIWPGVEKAVDALVPGAKSVGFIWFYELPTQPSIAIVIKTMDRSSRGLKNYLETTLQNLEQGGLWDSKTAWTLTIVDGGSDVDHVSLALSEKMRSDPRVSVVRADRPLTPNENASASWFHGWKRAAETGARWVLNLEDDIDVCERFVDETFAWLEAQSKSEYRLFPLNAPHQASGPVYQYPIGAFWAAQAVVARPEDAKKLSDFLFWNPKFQGTTQSHDLLIHSWMKQDYPKATHFLTPMPGFIQHIGEDSMLALTRKERDPNAIGFFRFPRWRQRPSYV